VNEKKLLNELCAQGKPLAEIHIVPVSDKDLADLIEAINGLGPDLEVTESGYNRLIHSGELAGHKLTILGDATKEALERLFGWIIRRAHLPKWNADKGVYEGFHDDVFYWVEETPPQFFPDVLKDRIESIDISQPGTNDNGKDDLVQYSLPTG
jgi:hypothetical protein